MFKILADTVITIHFFWILFLLFGAFAAVRWKPIKYLHIAGLVLAIIVQTTHSLCPLTRLESWLEVRAGMTAYSGSFIVHYLDKVIYLNAPETVIVVLTWVLAVFNVLLYNRDRLKRKINAS